jgi:hypothetical protein
MATKKQVEITHTDLLGVPLEIGCYVASSRRGQYSSTLHICEVVRFTPKRVELKVVKGTKTWSTPPEETIKLVNEDVLTYFLKA